MVFAITLALASYSVVSGSTITLTPAIGAATTTGSVSVTSSTRIMATTTNPADPTNSFSRAYATICNPNANPVYIALDNDQATSVSNATYVIAAAAGYNVCYEIKDVGYNGSITASSTNQTATSIFYSQYVY